MRKYLREFMAECEYPKEAREELLLAFEKLENSSFNALRSLIGEYDKSYNIDYTAAREKVRGIADKAGVHSYTAELLLFMCYTKSLRRYYREAGISDKIYLDTVLDLKYKLDECKCVYNVYGSFVAYWFEGFFKLTRFALGRLQFELVPLGMEYEKDGVHFNADSTVINVHIPRTGTRLNKESLDASYRLAAEFYRHALGKNIAFVCNSWLLFPRHREMLRDGSNLLRFISDYELFASGEYVNYNETWRLFDTNFDGDISKLPADTSLRKSYVELIKNGERTGWGKGIYIYENNKK